MFAFCTAAASACSCSRYFMTQLMKLLMFASCTASACSCAAAPACELWPGIGSALCMFCQNSWTVKPSPASCQSSASNNAAVMWACVLQGQTQRHVSSTQMNKESSRSHLIMSVIIEATNLQTQNVTRGKLSFVDLAGSER